VNFLNVRAKHVVFLFFLLSITACAENITLSLRVLFACDFIQDVRIDGVSTTEMNFSGKPYNVTVFFSSPAILRAVEYNGYLPFSLPQYVDSNVSNYAFGRGNLSGSSFSLALVPTGAETIAGFESAVGNYSVELRFALANDSATECVIYLNVSNRSLSTDYYHVSIPNRDHVAYFNDYVYRIYGSVKKWNGGEGRNYTVYTNGTAYGNFSNLTAGKPVEFNVTVLNHSDLSPVQGALVQVSEFNGFQPWSPLQYQDSSVSSAAVGRTSTGVDGNARLTVIPTGGLPSADGVLGNYSVNFSVYKSNVLAYERELLVSNRGLAEAPGAGASVANQANIIYFNDYVFRVYAGVKEWLWR